MVSEGVSLESVEIAGLFGRRQFTLELDQRRPTILTGANGTGKSTILRLISALSNADVVTLANAPLDQLALNFRGLPRLTMSREEDGRGFELTWGELDGRVSIAPTISDLPGWATQLLEDHNFDADDAIERMSDFASASGVPFPEYTAARDVLRGLSSEGPLVAVPAWLAEYGTAFPVLFVSDQRLVTERVAKRRRGAGVRQQRTSSLAVESAAFEVSEQIDQAFSAYGRTSQQLDRRFPQELIEAISGHKQISPERLGELVEEVDARREALKQVGLLEPDSYGPEVSQAGFDDEGLRPVMNAVLAATLQKLKVFDDLERRLSSFKAFLDNRFAPKVLVLTRSEGMRFETGMKQQVRPRQLSSGEQQMTVLAYEILFRAKPQTLVIVDEPELSLHVLWQDSLVDDLTRMGEISDLQFLMATHSPTIIAEHPELERALSGLSE